MKSRKTNKASEREQELAELLAVTAAIKQGKADDLFHDAETKAAILADLNEQAIRLIAEEFRANPGLYRECPDGSWEWFPDSERMVIELKDKSDGTKITKA